MSVQDEAAQLAAQLLQAAPGNAFSMPAPRPGARPATCWNYSHNWQSWLPWTSDELRLEKVSENLQRLDLQATVLTGDAPSHRQLGRRQL